MSSSTGTPFGLTPDMATASPMLQYVDMLVRSAGAGDATAFSGLKNGSLLAHAGLSPDLAFFPPTMHGHIKPATERNPFVESLSRSSLQTNFSPAQPQSTNPLPAHVHAALHSSSQLMQHLLPGSVAAAHLGGPTSLGAYALHEQQQRRLSSLYAQPPGAQSQALHQHLLQEQFQRQQALAQRALLAQTAQTPPEMPAASLTAPAPTIETGSMGHAKTTAKGKRKARSANTEADGRRQQRREKNRLAAQMCRQRKVEREQELRERLACLGQRRDDLTRQLAAHTRRHSDLAAAVHEHIARGCALPSPAAALAPQAALQSARAVSPGSPARSAGAVAYDP